jgi:quercetin dioxygenase-like cupin family protein|tara:strand:- start:200 stop:634 length:435 start_codon:yes stop_codon:yes gene_type:complete
MSIIEGKVWGTTIPLIQRPQLEVHSIFVNAGGYCSKHRHQSKINAFYVEEGELEIHRWKDYDLVDVTVLYTEDVSIVPAGEYHMFKARRDTKALEIYWSELSLNDIQREIVGGVDTQLNFFTDNIEDIFGLNGERKTDVQSFRD